MLGAKCMLALSTEEARQIICLGTLGMDATALVQDGRPVRYGLSRKPYYVQFHPLDDVCVNDEDDPPARDVVADTTLRSPSPVPLSLKHSLDLGIF